MIILLDTNIILDVLQNRSPHVAGALAIWGLCETGRVTGCISAITFNNTFYILRKQIGGFAHSPVRVLSPNEALAVLAAV